MGSNFKGWEVIIILVLLLLLFGAKRLPDAARGLGRSMRIFKAETKGLRDDDNDEPPTTSATAGTPAPATRELEGTTQPREQVVPARPVEPETHDR
jgi:sec-independent protein translocase protein TatA